MIRNSITRRFEIVDFDSLISIAPKKWEEAIFLIEEEKRLKLEAEEREKRLKLEAEEREKKIRSELKTKFELYVKDSIQKWKNNFFLNIYEALDVNNIQGSVNSFYGGSQKSIFMITPKEYDYNLDKYLKPLKKKKFVFNSIIALSDLIYSTWTVGLDNGLLNPSRRDYDYIKINHEYLRYLADKDENNNINFNSNLNGHNLNLDSNYELFKDLDLKRFGISHPVKNGIRGEPEFRLRIQRWLRKVFAIYFDSKNDESFSNTLNMLSQDEDDYVIYSGEDYGKSNDKLNVIVFETSKSIEGFLTELLKYKE